MFEHSTTKQQQQQQQQQTTAIKKKQKRKTKKTPEKTSSRKGNGRSTVLWGLFRRSMAANPQVSGPIWPKFELIQDIMRVLITCKFKEDRINSNREKVETSVFSSPEPKAHR